MLNLFTLEGKKKKSGQYLLFVHQNLLVYARERIEQAKKKSIGMAILEMGKKGNFGAIIVGVSIHSIRDYSHFCVVLLLRKATTF